MCRPAEYPPYEEQPMTGAEIAALAAVPLADLCECGKDNDDPDQPHAGDCPEAGEQYWVRS